MNPYHGGDTRAELSGIIIIINTQYHIIERLWFSLQLLETGSGEGKVRAAQGAREVWEGPERSCAPILLMLHDPLARRCEGHRHYY